ncbi:DNA cytosine methyltransferase [Agromyces larvae]|uniref:DNA (cytosine-5-)-methyltransferase n=1 Tax=Agromyces larvae TaxID=2929802 RepID=A0ABY4C3G5_9MICO|nr:DNA cytosine methyltransferase [Agromyces larvae]UOE45903.1 DNA cytosine methyltransferase [Agromyces larvae]
MSGIVVDLYAGVGVSQAVRRLGGRDLGVEIEPAAIAIREANEFETIYEDVWDAGNLAVILEGLAVFNAGQAWTLWASPPCQLWSMAGKGAAREHRAALVEAMHAGIYEDIDELRAFGASLGDENYAHVLVPLHYVFRYRPDYVAFEQVPPVLSLWMEMLSEFEKMGYSAKAANLQAEQYGVPQTRKRAILVARKKELGEVQLPTPTHSKYHVRDKTRLDPGVLPWVSMEEALRGVEGSVFVSAQSVAGGDRAERPSSEPGFTVTQTTSRVARWPESRPAPTVTGGGVRSGGAEPFGPGGRRAIRAARFEEQLHRRGDG